MTFNGPSGRRLRGVALPDAAATSPASIVPVLGPMGLPVRWVAQLLGVFEPIWRVPSTSTIRRGLLLSTVPGTPVVVGRLPVRGCARLVIQLDFPGLVRAKPRDQGSVRWRPERPLAPLGLGAGPPGFGRTRRVGSCGPCGAVRLDLGITQLFGTVGARRFT